MARCPECGRPFDPADETTMNMGREVAWLARWLMRPPGWPVHVLTVAAVVVSLWAAVMPTRNGAFADLLMLVLVLRRDWVWRDLLRGVMELGEPNGRFLVGVALWLLVAAIWITRRVARGITVWRISKQRAAPLAYWWKWLVTPVVFGVTVCLCRTLLPTYAGFWMSKPWLDQEVTEARAAYSSVIPTPRPIGLLPWYSQRIVQPDHVRFEFESCWLVQRDDGQFPQAPVGWHVRRLSSRWFLVERDPPFK
jgi:hypothetical protein